MDRKVVDVSLRHRPSRVAAVAFRLVGPVFLVALGGRKFRSLVFTLIVRRVLVRLGAVRCPVAVYPEVEAATEAYLASGEK